MKPLSGKHVVLYDSDLLRREARNREYLMELKNENLTLHYDMEAGRKSLTSLVGLHGGWESPTCQVRGHFTGHWLSAAAMHYHETGDRELLAKAQSIVDDIILCQKQNGNGWAAPIPEKYLHLIAKGTPVWAPQYTIHKTFMGLLDMYRYAGYEPALQAAEDFAGWFHQWSGSFTREEFDNILDFETGGMLEMWAQLYSITKKPMYKTLMDRYWRSRLFEPLLMGKDPLTNMHANTTVPEAMGCAAAYEATGEKRWRDAALAYWKCAVDDRCAYVTGGQTCGEIWSPKSLLGARLGTKAQEHCTVYNLMRLADHLFRWTKDPKYAAYRELALHNGIMAQAYWETNMSHGLEGEDDAPGLLTYFLPMRAGSKKGWSGKTDSFFCCHGSLVQANAAHNRGIYYQEDDTLYVCQYFDSDVTFSPGITLQQRRETFTANRHIGSSSSEKQAISLGTQEDHPDLARHIFTVHCAVPTRFTLKLRVPDWCAAPADCLVCGEAAEAADSWFTVTRLWNDGDTVTVDFPMGITAVPLPEDAHTVAFRYGPVALAGIISEERTLEGDPETILVHDNEREWGNWYDTFRTVGQSVNFRFVPLKSIGREAYTVYFPIQK